MTSIVKSESIGRALGRIPSGLFIVTYHNLEIDEPDGLLMSWVQQLSFEPPMVTVAVKNDRKSFQYLRDAGYFAVNVMGKENNRLVSNFYKGGFGASKFEGINYKTLSTSKAIALEDAVSYLECKLSAVLQATGDHSIFIGEVIHGELLNSDANEPSVHVRKNGFDY